MTNPERGTELTDGEQELFRRVVIGFGVVVDPSARAANQAAGKDKPFIPMPPSSFATNTELTHENNPDTD